MDKTHELRERLAALEHRQWAHWAKYLIESGFITDVKKVERWRQQINTPYEELSEAEKEADREWADQVLALLKEWSAMNGKLCQ